MSPLCLYTKYFADLFYSRPFLTLLYGLGAVLIPCSRDPRANQHEAKNYYFIIYIIILTLHAISIACLHVDLILYFHTFPIFLAGESIL